MASPLAQFEVISLVDIHIAGLNASFTNSGFHMAIGVTLLYAFFMFSTRHQALVPGRLQSIAELCYEFIGSMIRTNVGADGRRYFPFIFTLFYFILMGNMLGMVPYSFTYTSHIVVTFMMAMVIFVGVTVIAFVKHGFGFFHFFLPHGTPLAVAPLLIPIEILSYFTRPISLSLRLFANLTAGHTLLKVFAAFVFPMAAGGLVIAGILPLAVTVFITGLEIVIAFLQAYVFAVLTCIYLNDALHMH